MKLWIEVDENNRLTGYSSSPMDGFLEVETDKEPVNVGEWKYSGGQLVYDPDGYVAPEILDEPSELEVVKHELEKTQEDLTNTQLALAEVFEMIGGGA